MPSPLFAPLRESFYRPSARVVAPRLLGHYLLRPTPEGLAGGIIVETEAYLANDPSCHAFRRETARTRSMYGPPGRAYVYFIYGNYYCFNAVCRPRAVAEAVLIRAIEPSLGVDWMLANRPVRERFDLTSGPAKFCLALEIGRALDGVNLCAADSPVWIARNSAIRKVRENLGPIVTTTRIGISQAADWPLRFYLQRSHYVSRRGTAVQVA
jgi:DNA-3-methyladenine glycosylase